MGLQNGKSQAGDPVEWSRSYQTKLCVVAPIKTAGAAGLTALLFQSLLRRARCVSRARILACRIFRLRPRRV